MTMRLFEIGEDTEVYAAESPEAAKEYYKELVGEEEAASAFDDHFEEKTEGLAREFDFFDDETGVRQTTFRKLLAEAEEEGRCPCQISSAYY